MPSFYNVETNEPVTTMYISSTRKGYVVLKDAGRTGKGLMSFDKRPEVVVANGPGKAIYDPGLNPKHNEYRWKFTDLEEGSDIVVVDNGKPVHKIPVKRVAKLDSYKSIQKRFNRRGMKIDLDSHIDYVCYASEIVGEGVAFRPKDATTFKNEITDTQLFHHDDRSDPFGKTAASATIGEGYREVSTPSLHVAIHDTISSVHIDSYAFMLRSPNGDIIIGPDAGQHIFDELLFRMPMSWLRRKGHPFIASVLQALHPVLPNSLNRYSPILGLRVELGGSPNRDLRDGAPRFSYEATVSTDKSRRLRQEATLRLLHGGNADRSPDWVLSLKAQHECSDIRCHDHKESVGLFFRMGAPGEPEPILDR